MLTAVPRSWLSWDFSVLEGRRRVANIEVAWLRDAGTLTVRGRSFRVGREGWLSGAFYLEQGGRRVATAVKPQRHAALLRGHP